MHERMIYLDDFYLHWLSENCTPLFKSVTVIGNNLALLSCLGNFDRTSSTLCNESCAFSSAATEVSIDFLNSPMSDEDFVLASSLKI